MAGAVPTTVAFGNFSDLLDYDERIWVVYAYTASRMGNRYEFLGGVASLM